MSLHNDKTKSKVNNSVVNSRKKKTASRKNKATDYSFSDETQIHPCYFLKYISTIVIFSLDKIKTL